MSKKNTIEFRYYDMNPGDYLFALLGESWIREYGHDVDFQHFHNYLEIGYCRFGDGTMEFADEIKEYHNADAGGKPAGRLRYRLWYVDGSGFSMYTSYRCNLSCITEIIC